MIGYLRDPRTGAVTYNIVRNWVPGSGLLGVGLVTGVEPGAIAGAVLIAHDGLDRALGLGLKMPSSFRETHLGRIGRDFGDGRS